MSFSEQLIKESQPYFEAQVRKPFLVEILNGELPLDKFLYYVKVDYLYLVNHVNIWALAIAKSDDPDVMRVLSEQLEWSLNHEIPLLEGYADKFGIPHEELIGQRMGPLKYSYTRHQRACAYDGSLGELMAAALPCKLNYGEVGRALVKQKPVQPDNPYKDWLALYSSEKEESLAQKLLQIFDRLAAGSSESQLRKMRENYMTSLQYEAMLWDAYYAVEEWEAY
jgi:thiaminase/transcriptional activator TenA